MNLAEKVLRAKADYDAVYEAGKAAGGGGSYDEGYSAGYDAGMGEGLEVGRANGIEDGKQEATETLTETVLTDCNAVITEHLPAAETLAELPTKIGDVYGCGYTDGNDDGFATGQQIGHDSGVEVGKRQAYDAFWDTYQQNGTRVHYAGAYSGVGWTGELFKPKYDMKPQSAEWMFCYSRIPGDLDEILEQQGVTLDFSECRNFSYAFYDCRFTAIGTVDCSKATTSMPYLFGARTIVTVRNFIPPNFEMSYNHFGSGLKNLTVGGTITKSANFRESPLSRESIESVMAALSDTVTGQTATFNKAAAEAAFTTEEWETLVATKPNWTIAKA